MDYIICFVITALFTAGLILADKQFSLTSKRRIPIYVGSALISALSCYYLLCIRLAEMLYIIPFALIQLIMLLLSLWDMKEMEIPAFAAYALFLVCALMMMANPYCTIVNSVFTGGFMSLTLIVFYKLTKDKIGRGDVEVLIALGFAFGYPQVFGIIFAALFVSMIASICLMASKKAKLKTEIPFIPFLFIGMTLNIINL